MLRRMSRVNLSQSLVILISITTPNNTWLYLRPFTTLDSCTLTSAVHNTWHIFLEAEAITVLLMKNNGLKSDRRKFRVWIPSISNHLKLSKAEPRLGVGGMLQEGNAPVNITPPPRQGISGDMKFCSWHSGLQISISGTLLHGKCPAVNW